MVSVLFVSAIIINHCVYDWAYHCIGSCRCCRCFYLVDMWLVVTCEKCSHLETLSKIVRIVVVVIVVAVVVVVVAVVIVVVVIVVTCC